MNLEMRNPRLLSANEGFESVNSPRKTGQIMPSIPKSSKQKTNLPFVFSSDGTTKPLWQNLTMLTCNGSFDTRKDSGKPYKTMAVGELWAMAPEPFKVEKKHAPAIIPSSYCQHDGRNHNAQADKGQYVALTLDMDTGNLDGETVLNAVRDFVGDGVAVLVYSSSSSTPEKRKWRAIVPLSESLAFCGWQDLQTAFFEAVELFTGVKPDHALKRAGQLVYLPNVPPSKRDENGEPLFYEHHAQEGDGLEFTSALVQSVRDARAAAEAEAAAFAEAAMLHRQAKRAPVSGTGDGLTAKDLRDAFNAENAIESLLSQYGYKQRGHTDHWRSPYQESGSYATRNYGTHWVSLSGSDQTAGLGQTCEGGCFGDAFDLFVHFEHGGNTKKATYALGEDQRAAARVQQKKATAPALSRGTTFAPLDEAAPQTQQASPLPPVGEPPAMTEDEELLKSAALAIPPSATLGGKHCAYEVIAYAVRHHTANIAEDVGLHIVQAWDAMHCPDRCLATKTFTTADPNYGGMPLGKASVYKMAHQNGWVKPTTEAGDDNHRNAPRPDPDCLYGLIGDVGRAAHRGNKEVNPYAAALGFMVALSAGVGRGCFLHVGDDWHNPRLFAIHVGRSGRGRKGSALKLTRRILDCIEEKHKDVAFQVHSGGLSTREGLVKMIHDKYTVGIGQNAEEIPAVEDKRLMVIESEFVNVLHQAAREGNTLSAALREAWDGQGIKPATKMQPIGVRYPHINLIGNITPSELKDCMKTRELSNGFANRFIMIWAESPTLDPLPNGVPTHIVEELGARMADVLRWAQADRFVERDRTRVCLSKAAATEYKRLYARVLNDSSHGEPVTGLLPRRAAYLLRLAMLFAITDQTETIELHHLNAAMAWVRYWVESVKFVFSTAKEEAKAEQTHDTAARILDYLGQHKEVTRTQLANDCFKKRLSKDVLDAAIYELLTATPPKIQVHTRKTTGAVKQTKVYTHTPAEFAEFAEFGVNTGFFPNSAPLRNLRNLRTLENPREFSEDPSPPNTPPNTPSEIPHEILNSAKSAKSATPADFEKSEDSRQIPQIPQIPQRGVFMGADSDDGRAF